jgi:hypothetical protein
MEMGGSFVRLLLYPQRKSSCHPLYRKLGDPHSQYTFCMELQAMNISLWIFGKK